jgi:hypothetical protein
MDAVAQCLDDFIDENNPVSVLDAFVDALNLTEMSFEGVEPAATGRPSYHPSVLLKLYIYGYLNRVQSSRQLSLYLGIFVQPLRLTLHQLAGLSLHAVRIAQAKTKSFAPFVPSIAPLRVMGNTHIRSLFLTSRLQPTKKGFFLSDLNCFSRVLNRKLSA